MKRILLVLLIILVSVVGLSSPAQADSSSSASLTFYNSINSIGPITVLWENNYTGVRYWEAVPVGAVWGECACPNSTSEPQTMRVGNGYCLRWKFHVDGYTTVPTHEFCNYSGTIQYINITPGDTYGTASSDWQTEARSFRAP